MAESEIPLTPEQVMEQLKSQVSYRIDKEPFTIEEKIELIKNRIGKRSEILFTELFEGVFDRIDVIITFLAVLEIVKSGFLAASQMSQENELWLYKQERTKITDEERKINGISA